MVLEEESIQLMLVEFLSLTTTCGFEVQIREW